jgi:hypothetical protein
VLTGTGNTWQPFYGGMRSEKVFDISPSTNSGASYTIGLYFTTAELAGLDPATLKIAKTDASTIATATAGNTIIAPTSYVSYANGYLFTASFTGFSKFFLVDPNVVLPLTLVTFNGTLNNNNNNILLSWKTSSEQGSKYFDVEKSPDAIAFQSIGKVTAAGNSSLVSNYSYTDKLVNEYNYYRLKIVDIDGKFTYSSTILLKDVNVSQRVWVDNNPFHDIINIRFARSPRQKVRVELLNANGAKVYFKEFGSSIVINLNVSGVNLAAGVYLLRTTVDDKIYVNRLVKQ